MARAMQQLAAIPAPLREVLAPTAGQNKESTRKRLPTRDLFASAVAEAFRTAH
jgi:hypothetical protein